MKKTNSIEEATKVPERLSFVAIKCEVSKKVTYVVEQVEHENLLIEIKIPRYKRAVNKIQIQKDFDGTWCVWIVIAGSLLMVRGLSHFRKLECAMAMADRWFNPNHINSDGNWPPLPDADEWWRKQARKRAKKGNL